MRNDIVTRGGSAVELKAHRADVNGLVEQLARLRRDRAQEAEDALQMADARQRAAFIIGAVKGPPQGSPATPRFGLTWMDRSGFVMAEEVSFRGALVLPEDLMREEQAA